MHTDERTLSPFATLDLRGAVDVTIRRGRHLHLAVVGATAKATSRIVTRQEGDRLLIESKTAGATVVTHGRGGTIMASGGSIAAGGDLVIHRGRGVTQVFSGPVALVCEGDMVDLAGEVPRVELVVPTVPNIRAAGAGDVRVEGVSQESLSVSLVGSGNIRLQGRVGVIALVLQGSGDIEAEGMPAERGTIRLQGSGDIRACVSDQVGIELSGSGDVTVGGNPARRDTRIRGSGDVSFRP